MEELRLLTGQDRILILSPHPDDESLATGGLIQAALEAGAAIRVLYASNGDNNPWPQRVMERRLRINAADRDRWGAMRQHEAREALARLGLTQTGCVEFLGFPDQGFNRAVLDKDDAPLKALKREIENFRPTLMITPSLHDRHPDHNSLAVFASLALQQVRAPVERLVYLVHTNGRTPLNTRIGLELTPAQQRRKRDAISAHASQMLLSRRRLLRHAAPVETYYKPVPPEAEHAHHPLVSAHVSGGRIHLCIPIAETPRFPAKLFIAMESPAEGGQRWVLPLPARSGNIVVRDAVTGVVAGQAGADVSEAGVTIRIPVSRLEPLNQIFIKLKSPTLFFEKTGWREVSVAPLPPSAGPVSLPRPAPAANWISKNSRAWAAISVLALAWLTAVLTENIRRPWVDLVDFNGAVWSQAAHNILRAGLVPTEGASTGFYFGPLPIPPGGYYLHHPPLLHLLLTWMFALLGEHEWVARLLPVSCSIASGILVWWLARSCAGARAAAFALAIFACLPMELRYGSMVNFEPVVLTLILAALCCLRQWSTSGRVRWKALAAGFMIAGMWVDWAMYIFALVLCVYWFARPHLKMRRFAGVIVASMLVSGALYLLRIEMLRPDALQSLANAFFRRIGSSSKAQVHFTEIQWLQKIARILFIHFLAVGWTLALAGGFIIRRKKSADPGLAWLGWACSAVAVMDLIFLCAFQNESYIHRYIGYYLVAPVAILGGVALNEALDWLQARLARRSPWSFAGACMPCMALLLLSGWWGVKQTDSLRKQFLVLDYTTPEPPDLIPELGETIRDNFPPDARVLCNFLPDYGPQLDYYAQRNLLNNVDEYRFWREFLDNPSQKNLGGVVWMNTPYAGEIVSKLPAGTRRYVKLGNFSFCIWKPASPLKPSSTAKRNGTGRS